MSFGEEQVECPLCMEPLEIDDVNFYPCTCGYQICRFCWHRIRTDENGLCPACRKQYPEDPAEFKPLTEDELQRIKKERRQKDLQRKQKAAENRKHLANVRVVQKNLVFVVGLSQRLADPEVLKKHEYFGKFGKIHKVVINQNTSYAGAQGPSAGAYVTYNRSEDALKALLVVNNIKVDGRTLKANLGTTKYCSHFLKGSQCPKGDCMYLHELGEEAASFTKEEMTLGKHQEYEQKLLESFMNSQNTANNHLTHANKNAVTRKKSSSPITVPQTQKQQTNPPQKHPSPQSQQNNVQKITQQHSPPLHTHTAQHKTSNSTNSEAWPSLNIKPDQPTSGTKLNNSTSNHLIHRTDTQPGHNRAPGGHKQRNATENEPHISIPEPSDRSPEITSPDIQSNSPTQKVQSQTYTTPPVVSPNRTLPSAATLGATRKALALHSNTNSLSFFSGNGFRNPKPPVPPTTVPESVPTTEIAETIPVSSTTDWQTAFGFGPTKKETQDDDLGFDPWDESAKGLADLIEKESGNDRFSMPHYPQIPHSSHGSIQSSRPLKHPPTHNLPPGFSLSHIQQQQLHQEHVGRPDLMGARMMGFMQSNMHPMHNTFQDVLSDIPNHGNEQIMPNAQVTPALGTPRSYPVQLKSLHPAFSFKPSGSLPRHKHFQCFGVKFSHSY
ncbi:hypothetical protein ScPMuIL_016144 [Solemya velum]